MENPFELILRELAEIKLQNHQLLTILMQTEQPEIKPEKEYLTAEEVIEIIPSRPKLATLYQWTHFKKIPHTRHGKKLVFEKKTIMEWAKAGYPKNNK